MRLTFLLAIFMSLVTIADGQELIGSVIDKESNTPVAGVEIKVIGRSSSAKTNAKGDFKLFVSLGYPCLVEFSKRGYQTHALNLEKQPEESVQLKLASSVITEAPVVLKDLNTYECCL